MSETVERGYQSVIENFKKLEVGQTMTMEIAFIKPSQTDDNIRNESTEPIAVFMDQGQVKVDTGNHRYYTHKSKGETTIIVKKVSNPYLNW
jgi:hypothetical protein